ncbi:MAG: hypothetical protein ABFE07_28210 [Armatimonadia bacterium]
MVAIRKPQKKPEPEARDLVAEVHADTEELRHKLLGVIGQHGAAKKAKGRPASDHEVLSALVILIKDISSELLMTSAKDQDQAATVQLISGALSVQRSLVLRKMQTENEPVPVTCLSLAAYLLSVIIEGREAREKKRAET